MRFQDAALDGRAVVYAGIQADPLVVRLAGLLADASAGQLVLARAVMNGMRTDPVAWRTIAPSLFPDDRSEAILAASLEVADRGEQVRSQFRGAVVEALAELLLRRRGSGGAVRRERRILFDGVRAEIHPYDVTLERPGRADHPFGMEVEVRPAALEGAAAVEYHRAQPEGMVARAQDRGVALVPRAVPVGERVHIVLGPRKAAGIADSHEPGSPWALWVRSQSNLVCARRVP